MVKSHLRGFGCYAHLDKAVYERFRSDLLILFSACAKYDYSLFHDVDISLGALWRDEIDSKLEGAHFGIVHASAAFFGSEFIKTIEKKKLYDRGIPVFPVALRPLLLGHFDMNGLEEHQIFHLELANGRRLAYSECQGQLRERFVHQFYVSVADRLRSIYP